MINRKKIFINASTVLFSGGLILTQSIIESLVADGSFELIITCPRLGPYQHFVSNRTKIKIVPGWMLSRLLRCIHDYIWLPLFIKQNDPNIVLTLSNIPARTRYKQIFLHDNAYLVENNLDNIPLSFKSRIIHKLRSMITLKRIKFISLILVQTDYQKEKIITKLKCSPPIKIITPSIPFLQKTESGKPSILIPPSGKIKVLCLSRYYEHKNIEVLFKLAELIKSEDLPFIIYLTISKNHGKKASALIKLLKNENFDKVLVNLGHFSHNNLPAFINQVDAIILPSLLESFSLSFIEAWYYRKPLFVSDLTSMRSSCKNGALYFDPSSPANILRCLTDAFNQPAKISAIVQEGEKRLKELANWSDYVTLLNEF